MAKATKKTNNKTNNRTTAIEMPTTSPMSQSTQALSSRKLSNKTLTLALVALAIGLLTYKVGPWVVPALVNNSPVSRFEIASRLEKAYGAQALDDIVNEKILDQAISKAGVKIDEAKLTEQIKALETQFESTGGLDEALKQRGLTRKDLEKQIRTQLSVEIILSDKINPSEEEVKAQYTAGAATLYKDKKIEDVADAIKEELKASKLRDSFLTWFEEVKKDAKITNFGL
ncbi:SurA N-terminal domain-containing protein [Candidatus Woesebacteria bacterium]|nr:SurA N-terminal domain-containing protein [Candidatus Woesebacteria bacterium]